MKFHLILVVLLIFLKKATTDYIECYVCEDCEENVGELVSCALLGELQLIDPLINSEADNVAQINTTQTTTTVRESNNTTSVSFENATTTTATVKQNLTTVSIPNAIDSMESYEEMEWAPQGPATTTKLDRDTMNTTSGQKETLSINATVILANATAETTVNGTTVLLPGNITTVMVNLTSNLQPNITMNTIDVIAQNATTSENFLNSTTVATRPNTTSATVIGNANFANITATNSSTLNTLVIANSTMATGVLELNGTAISLLENGNTSTVVLDGTTSVNVTNQATTTDLNSGNVTTTRNETTSPVGLNSTNPVNGIVVSSGNGTTIEISTLANATTNSVGLNGLTPVNAPTLNSGNTTTTGIPILANETTNSVGLNGTTQVNSTTVSSGNVTTTEISILGNDTTNSVGLNGTAQFNTTTLNSGNTTTTGISILANEATNSVGLNGTTQVNSTTVSSGNVTATGISILGNEITSPGKVNGTIQGTTVNFGNLTTVGNSILVSGAMNSTLAQVNFTNTDIKELTNVTNGNMSNGALQNINGILQNVTTTLLPNLPANITGNSEATKLNGTSTTTTMSLNNNITSPTTATNKTQILTAISEEYSDEDDSDTFSGSEERFHKPSKAYFGKLDNKKDVLNAEASAINAVKQRNINKGSKAFLVRQNPTDFLLNKYSKLRYAAGLKQVNITYKCYTVRIRGKDKVQTNKGCIAVPAKQTACELLATKYGKEALQHCEVCPEGKCNNRSRSSDLKTSLAGIISTILIAWLLS